MSLPTIYAALLACAVLFSMARGSREARLIAGGYLIAQLTAMLISRGRYDTPQLRLFVVDLLLLGWLSWIIMRTSLLWPIALCVLQVLTVLGHVARISSPGMEKMGYFVLLQWTAWPAFVAMLIGIGLDWRAGRTSAASWRVRE